MTTATTGRRSKLPAILVGVATACAVIVVAIIGIALLGTNAGGGNAAAPQNQSAPAASPTPAASAAPTLGVNPAVVLDPAKGPTSFMSASANIMCTLDGDSVSCVLNRSDASTYPVAVGCDAPAVDGSVRLDATGISYPCVTVLPAESNVLARETPLEYGDITCILRETVGITCTDADGVGFSMGVDAGLSLLS